MRWLRRLIAWFRPETPDDRWWEDGWPVEHRVQAFRPSGEFDLVVRKLTCKAEFDVTVDWNRQVFGDPSGPKKELTGLRAGCYNAPATFRCECGFRVAGATEYEVEWIGTEHRALIHGDERDSDDE